MPFKLSSIKELFPDKAKKLEAEEKKVNLGKMFDIPDAEKKKIVKLISECVQEAEKQRSGMMDIKRDAIQNYEGTKQNNGPWEGSSNVSTMVTTIASDMMHAKLFPMVWNPDMLHFVGRDKNDKKIAENNKIMIQWAVTKDMEDSQDKADEIIHRLVVEGFIAAKVLWETYYVYVTRAVPESVTEKGDVRYKIVYDQVKRERAKWIIKDMENVFFPYNAKNVREAEYIIDRNYYTLPILLELKERGLLLPTLDMDLVKTGVEKMIDPDGTAATRNEALGLEEFNARVESYPIKTYEAFIKYDINKDNIREECVFITFPELGIYASGKPLHVVSRVGQRPWVLRSFLRRPGTMYGKGIPELVRHLHNEMDAIHNQRIDAGNMVIAPFFFFRAASGFDPKRIEVKPAMGIPLDDPQRDVFFPNYNAGRLSVSFQEEALVMDLIEKLTYLTPTMLGRETASRPTARGTLAVIAQGEQKFTLLAARVAKIFNDLLTITRRFYEENLDPMISARIIGVNGNQVWGNLSPEMIAGDYDAIQDIDLSSTTESLEKQADQIMYQTMVQDPLVNQNPAYAWELRACYLKALGKKDFEKIIGPKPDYEMNPGDIQDENMMMWQEQEVAVGAKDDHLAHINSHAEFKRTMSKSLTPESLTRFAVHLLEHRYQYQNRLQELAMTANQGGANAGSGQNSPSGAYGTPGMNMTQGQPIQGPPVQGDQNAQG